ncbi:MAG: hypothetical protein ACK5NG_03860 [Chthoniobacterales bacterium]
MSTLELQEIVAANARSIAGLKESQAETDRQMKETDRKLKELSSLFSSQWGKLVEALLRSGLPKLFRARGLAVTELSRNVEVLDKVSGEKRAEIDVFLQNGGEDVAVEVKTTCRPKDVDEHIERLQLLHGLISAYGSGKKLYGAVAALRFESGADTYAEKKGLFVLKCTDNIATIANPGNFRPKAW